MSVEEKKISVKVHVRKEFMNIDEINVTGNDEMI